MEPKQVLKEAQSILKDMMEEEGEISRASILAEHKLGEAYLKSGHPDLEFGIAPDLGYDISDSFKAVDDVRQSLVFTKGIVDHMQFRVLYDPGFFEKHPNFLKRKLQLVRRERGLVASAKQQAKEALNQFKAA